MRKVFGFATVLIGLATLFSCELSNDTVAPPLSSQKELTSFSFPAVPAVGSIVGSSIAVSVPYGTSLNAMVAQFSTTGRSVTVGSTTQVSGTTVNNFTTPVVYRVTAADKSIKDYTVTVTPALSPAKELTAFSFPAVGATGVFSGTNIAVSVPFGTSLGSLVATFTTTGASVSVGSTTQVSGTTANSFANQVTYRVTAADGSFQDYTVTVTPALSPAKELTAFSFPAVGATGVFSGTNIAVSVPFGTSLGSLVATFTTTGASVSVGSTTQVSGTTANGFANQVTYRVTAADGSFQDYKVTVTLSDPLGALVGTYQRSETNEYDPTNLPGASTLSTQTLVVAPSGSPSSVSLVSLPNDVAKNFGFSDGTMSQVIEVTVLSGGGTTAVTVLMHVIEQSGTGIFTSMPLDLAKAWTKNLYTLSGNTLTTQVSEGSPNAEDAIAVTSFTATQTWTKQ